MTKNSFLKTNDIFGIPLIKDKDNNFNQRLHYPMDAKYITLHNFGLQKSAEEIVRSINKMNKYKTWHFTVGKDKIYQMMDINFNAWHTGKEIEGEGNRKSIAIEIEENEQSMENAIKLVAYLKLNGKYEIKTHQDWTGRYCPRWILCNHHKEYFVNKVDEITNREGDGYSYNTGRAKTKKD